MKILLINSDLPDMGVDRILPLSMYYVGGMLKKYGYEIKIIDPMLYRTKFFSESIYDVILRESIKCDVICCSINSFSYGYTLKLMKYVKDSGYTGKIIFGGVHATHEPKEILNHNIVDYVIVGEAENALATLLSSIENNIKGDIPNIITNVKNTSFEKNIHKIDKWSSSDYIFPAYDLVPKGAYDFITIETSRGCYGNCTFCSIPNKTCWRSFPNEYIIENIKKALPFIEEKFTSPNICFTDDCFTMNINRAINLLDQFNCMPIKDYNMLIESRLLHLKNKELLSKIKVLPNLTIQVGIECGYDRGLKKINKGITRSQILECSEMFYDEGISHKLFYSFIIGFPWESVTDCEETLDLMSILKHKYGISVNCSWWLPVPSTDFDILKSMDDTINSTIFAENGWVTNQKIYRKCHPSLNDKDIFILTKKISDQGLRA